MHWPVSTEGKDTHEEFVDVSLFSYSIPLLTISNHTPQTWRAMSLLLATGTVRHIGICNFSPSQLDTLIASTGGLVKPYAHQFELHPYLPQTEFIEWHKSNDIKVTAYSPLGNMNPTYSGKSTTSTVGVHGIISQEVVPPLLQNSLIRDIAEKRRCTPAQVALAWNLQRDVVVIPKSAHASRIAENFASEKECVLKPKDIEALKHLPVKRFNNPSKDYGVKLFQGLEDSDVDLDESVAVAVAVHNAVEAARIKAAELKEKVEKWAEERGTWSPGREMLDY